jgi:hypothetical protein
MEPARELASANAVHFVRGRLHFRGASSAAVQDCALAGEIEIDRSDHERSEASQLCTSQRAVDYAEVVRSSKGHTPRIILSRRLPRLRTLGKLQGIQNGVCHSEFSACFLAGADLYKSVVIVPQMLSI